MPQNYCVVVRLSSPVFEQSPCTRTSPRKVVSLLVYTILLPCGGVEGSLFVAGDFCLWLPFVSIFKLLPRTKKAADFLLGAFATSLFFSLADFLTCDTAISSLL